MLDRFANHTKNTWDHVLHLDASAGEYVEAGAEVVGAFALAAVARSASRRLFGEVLAGAEGGSAAAGKILSAEARTGMGMNASALGQEAATMANSAFKTVGRPTELLPVAKGVSSAGEKFYLPTPVEQETMSVTELSRIAQSNQQNLLARVAAFGDDFPRVGFHTCNKAGADQLEAALAGGPSVERYLALPIKQAPTAEGKLADLTASYKHASLGGYHYGDPKAKFFAFDVSSGPLESGLYQKGATFRELPAPFKTAYNAGEVADWQLTAKSKLVLSVDRTSLIPYQPNPSLPDYMARIKHLEPIDYQSKLDMILSALERARKAL